MEDLLQEGFNLVSEAIQFDNNGKIADAIAQYDKALVKLQKALEGFSYLLKFSLSS